MQGTDMMSNQHLNLVLLGRTGAGKSSSGNTILGREAFATKKNSISVTQGVAVASGTICRMPVTVYDTPGFSDTELSEEDIGKYEEVLQNCKSGLCAFLLVIKADRLTEKDRKTVEMIEKLLGEKHLQKSWILFTGEDKLEENMTINQLIHKAQSLKKLVQKYDGRFHVFNNKIKGPSDQVKFLTSKVCQRNKELSKIQLQDAPVSSLSSRRIVLLGKTGVGKSAAGNAILGKKEFKSAMRMIAVTTECSDACATISGRSVSVVDTPGFFDTQMNHEELVSEMARSVYISSPGPHAFLIVFRVDDRFTDQEQQITEQIKMLFGQEVLKYSIILFTHGDQLDEDTIEEYIERYPALRCLVDQCGGRFHVFDNRNQNNREQVNELLQKIDTMIEQNGGGHYSNQMFEDAHRFRQEEEEQRQREEEERKQQEEEQRLEEIEKIRAEIEARQWSELERIKAEIKSENRQRKEHEKQMQDEIERMRKETEERIRAEFETERSELERLEAEGQREREERKQEEKRSQEKRHSEHNERKQQQSQCQICVCS